MWTFTKQEEQILSKQPDCLARSDSGDLFISYYGLDDAQSQAKSGGLHIVKTAGEEVQCECDAGVLDFKLVEPDRVVACMSDGSLRVFAHSNESIVEVSRHRAVDTCATYVSVLGNSAAVTSTDGKLALVDVQSGLRQQCFSISPYESWFSHIASSGTYASAGTEIVFLPTDEGTLQRIPTSHTSEICSFRLSENQLVTGDFSGRLITTDLRTQRMAESVQIASAGVWRFMNWEGCVVAACMQDGVHCLTPSAHISDHSQSLVYGLCIQSTARSGRVTTCSFYDKVLSTWELHPPTSTD